MRVLCIIFFLCISTTFSSAQMSHGCDEDLFPVKQPDNRQYGYQNLFGIWRIQPSFTLAYPFTGKVAIVLKGKFYGGVSCQARMVIPAIYKEIKPFVRGYAWVRKDDKWGLVHESGKVILEPQFVDVHDISKYSDVAWVKKEDTWAAYHKDNNQFLSKFIYTSYQRLLADTVSLVKLKNGKSGVLSMNTGQYIVAPDLDHVQRMTRNCMIVQRGIKYGMLNDYGRFTIPVKYDSIVKLSRYRFAVWKNRNGYFYNQRGKKINKTSWTSIEPFNGVVSIVKKGNKFGFVHFSGRLVIPIHYSEVSPFVNGRSIVKQNGVYGVIDTKNNPLIPIEYKKILRGGSNPFFAVQNQESKWLLKGTRNEELSATEFDEIIASDEPLFIRIRQGDKWGYFSTGTRSLVTAIEYDKANIGTHGFAFVKKGDEVGVINVKGETVIECQYDSLQYTWLSGELRFRAYKNGKLGIVYTDGKQLLPIEYDLIAKAGKVLKVKKNGVYGIMSLKGQSIVAPIYLKMSNQEETPQVPDFPAIVQLKKKVGLIGTKGEYIIKPMYQSIRFIGKSYYAIQKKKKYGIITSKGKEIIPIEAQQIAEYSDKLIGVKSGGLWGYVNMNGKLNIKYQFEQIGSFKESIACVKKNGKWGVINRSGKIIRQPEYDGYEVTDGKRYLLKGNTKVLLSTLFTK